MFLRAQTDQPWVTFHSDELAITGLTLLDWLARRISYDQIVVDFQRTLVRVHNAEGTFEVGRYYLVMTTFEADLDRGAYYSYGFYLTTLTTLTLTYSYLLLLLLLLLTLTYSYYFYSYLLLLTLTTLTGSTIAPATTSQTCIVGTPSLSPRTQETLSRAWTSQV